MDLKKCIFVLFSFGIAFVCSETTDTPTTTTTTTTSTTPTTTTTSTTPTTTTTPQPLTYGDGKVHAGNC